MVALGIITDPDLLLSANWSNPVPDPVITLLEKYPMVVFGLNTVRHGKDVVKNASTAQRKKVYLKNISAMVHANELMRGGSVEDLRDASSIKVGKFTSLLLGKRLTQIDCI